MFELGFLCDGDWKQRIFRIDATCNEWFDLVLRGFVIASYVNDCTPYLSLLFFYCVIYV